MLSYILEVSLCWGAFYLLYWLLLSRDTFFHFNRWYLVSTLLASLVIPAVEWELPHRVAESEIATVYFQPITVGVETFEVTVTATPITSGVEMLDVLTWIYWAGMAFCMIRFLIGMQQIYKLYRRSEKRQLNGYQLILSEKVHPPFSFFNNLFISKSVELDAEDREAILRHELAHIRGGHSYDILILEILNAVFWCSPFIYLYRRSLRNVHEYIADAAVLRTTKKKQYGHLLIRQSQSGPAIAIANHFHSQLKKRILMMMRNPSKRQAMLKYLLVIPLTLLVLLAFSNAEAKQSMQQQAQELQQAVEKNLEPYAVKTEVSSENFTKFEVVNGEIRFEAKDGVTVKMDTVPISLNSKSADDRIVNFEIYYANGEVEKLTSKVNNNNKILENINPGDIESMEVFRNDGQNLIKIWLKGSKKDKPLKVNELDQVPLFPGCEDVADQEERRKCAEKAMLTFVYKQIRYPAAARENGIQGSVVVSFTIDENGNIKNPEIKRGIGGGCDEEVMRIVKEMPRWHPGKKDGKAVSTIYILPVKYKLEGENAAAESEKKPLQDTIITFDPITYEEKIKIVDRSANEVVVVGYGVNQKNKSMPSETEEIFKVVEEMPRFPGCEDSVGDEKMKKDCADRKMLEFIYKNIKYPKEARDKGIEGMVVVSFIVEKDGSVTNAEIKRDIGGGCDEEALRVINLMPAQNLRWIPGKQQGQPVRVLFNIPIRFKLDTPVKKEEANFPPPPPIAELPANTLKLQDFKASPNPTNGILNVSFKGERKPTVVKVFDLQGKELQSLNLQNFDGSFSQQLDLSKASKGTLIITVTQGDKTYAEKIILQ